jgi:hypothetical protein
MSEVKVDTISERTAAGGVTIDGVLIKDGVATFQTAAGSPLVFEGATADAFETTFAFTDPTADRTITFPDSSFTVPTAGGLFSGYAIFADQKTLGTDGGTFTSGAWRDRDLNTTIANTDTTNITLGTNDFTLLAGNYFIHWMTISYDGYNSTTRLYDGTSSVGVGQPFHNNATGGIFLGDTRVTPGTSTTYQLQHQCTTTEATIGFGLASDASIEQYTTVTIYKES